MTTASKKIKVLGFDSWTQGSHHYSRLVKDFAAANIELSLTHLGSWGEDKNRDSVEVIDGLLVHDISYYKDPSFSHVLEVEKPDVVLFLWTESFLHKAFQRYCIQNGIPTINLFHALWAGLPYEEGKQVYASKFIGLIRNGIKRSKKFFAKSFKVYAISLLQTQGTARASRKFLIDVVTLAMGKEILKPGPDTRANRCCIYADIDRDLALSKWNYKSNELIAVGNPDIFAFEIQDKIGSYSREKTFGSKTIVYIDTGFSSQGFYFDSDEHYKNYLLECNVHLRKSGYKLLFKVKPHPELRRKYFEDNLPQHGIDVLSNKDVIESLLTSKACIVEPSSFAFIPCLLGVPVLLNRVGPLVTQKYSRVFESYPESKYVNSWEGFDSLVADCTSEVNPRALKKWIEETAGPMPATDMPKRVARVVRDLVMSNRSRVLKNENN